VVRTFPGREFRLSVLPRRRGGVALHSPSWCQSKERITVGLAGTGRRIPFSRHIPLLGSRRRTRVRQFSESASARTRARSCPHYVGSYTLPRQPQEFSLILHKGRTSMPNTPGLPCRLRIETYIDTQGPRVPDPP